MFVAKLTDTLFRSSRALEVWNEISLTLWIMVILVVDLRGVPDQILLDDKGI